MSETNQSLAVVNAKAPATIQPDPTVLERVVAMADLSKLSSEQRMVYYRQVCESLGLNPLTAPFIYVTLRNGGPLTLYATKGAAEQLARRYRVSVATMAEKLDEDGIFTVTARAIMPDGRFKAATGRVYIEQLRGQERANAKMKAESKSHRRAILGIIGLGWMDEVDPDANPDVRIIAPEDEPTRPALYSEAPENEAPPRRRGSIHDLFDVPKAPAPSAGPVPDAQATAPTDSEDLIEWFLARDATLDCVADHCGEPIRPKLFTNAPPGLVLFAAQHQFCFKCASKGWQRNERGA